jgi:hypothetical protein
MALVSVGMFVGLLGGSALAETRIIKLSGLDEVPVVITGATGELRVQIPRDEQTIEYTLSYEGIEGGAVLQAHSTSDRSTLQRAAISSSFCART